MIYAVMFHHFHDTQTESRAQGSMSASQFHQVLDWLEGRYTILSPAAYIQKVVDDRLAADEICLTFDDALESQYSIAYPVMKDRGLRAFYFVYSGAFTERPPMFEFFRDFRVTSYPSVDAFYDEFFSYAARMDENLIVKLNEKYPPNYLSQFSFYSVEDRRFRFFRDHILGDSFFPLMQSLIEASGYDVNMRRKRLFMSEDNLKKLYDDGNEIGLHSHTHPTQMQTLDKDSQQAEYDENHAFLSKIVDGNVRSMSHPCGEYNEDTLAILNAYGVEIGFRSSLSPLRIASALEVPRQDHANIIREMESETYEDHGIHKQPTAAS